VKTVKRATQPKVKISIALCQNGNQVFLHPFIIIQIGLKICDRPSMNSAQYRRQAATQNRHRLWLCLAFAGVLHLGAIVLIHRPTRPSLPPIQFIAIDPIQPASQPVRAASQPSPGSPQFATTRSLSVLSTSPSSTKPAAAKDKIWNDYLAALRRKIYQEWQTLPVTIERPIKVRFAIDRQGNLVDLVLVQSGQDGIADQAALRAVQRVAPFAKLPIAAPEEQLRVTFTFDEP
jgi:TonB family protein